MADRRDVLQRVCEENLGGISLKREQQEAVISLLDGKDVYAVLPTRFGKSLVYWYIKAMRLRGTYAMVVLLSF